MNLLLEKAGLSKQTGLVLRLAHTAVWNDLKATLAPFGLKPQSHATLTILANVNGCKQQDVADALGIKRPNFAVLVDDLAANGLLERRTNPGDRRSYALSISDKGLSLLKSAEPAHQAHELRIAKTIQEAALCYLHSWLSRLAGIDADDPAKAQ